LRLQVAELRIAARQVKGRHWITAIRPTGQRDQGPGDPAAAPASAVLADFVR
jgi:hypothetical protein